MRSLFVFAIILSLVTVSHAQTTTSVQLLTSQEQQYLNTAKGVYKEYQKLHKKYLKDSVKLSKKAVREAEKEYSTKASSLKEKGSNSKQQLESEVNNRIQSISDSLYNYYGLEKYDNLTKEYSQYRDEDGSIDWNTLSKDQLNKHQSELTKYDEYNQLQSIQSEYTDEYSQAKSYVENPDTLFTSDVIDKAAESHIAQLDEVKELQTQSGELEAVKELPSQYSKILKQYQERVANLNDKEALSRQATEHAKSLGKDFLKVNADKIESAQTQLTTLKKKYSKVLSSNDLSTAIKANSLQEEPFKNRLVLGGTFQLSRGTKTTNLDLAPIIGYKFNKQWSAGLSGVFRASFGQQEEFFDYIMQDQVYGGRVYTEFIFYKGFFGHGEYERMNNQMENTTTGEKYRIWSDGILVGIGKNYKIKSKLQGNVMVLYNTIHNEGTSPYNSPWQVRFGVHR